MKQGSEAFQPRPHLGKEVPPEKKREAVILPFQRKMEGRNAPNPLWSAHAKFMAQAAGITLSPETIALYGRLRDEKPDPEKENHSGMSDQELLAEALHMSGDEDSFTIFTGKYPHIFNPKL